MDSLHVNCRFTSRTRLEEIAKNKTVDGQRIVDEVVGGRLTIIYNYLKAFEQLAIFEN